MAEQHKTILPIMELNLNAWPGLLRETPKGRTVSRSSFVHHGGSESSHSAEYGDGIVEIP